MLTDAGAPVTDVAEGSAELLKPRSELAVGARVAAAAPPLADVVWEREWAEPLWPGSTLAFRARREAAAEKRKLAWQARMDRQRRPDKRQRRQIIRFTKKKDL